MRCLDYLSVAFLSLGFFLAAVSFSLFFFVFRLFFGDGKLFLPCCLDWTEARSYLRMVTYFSYIHIQLCRLMHACTNSSSKLNFQHWLSNRPAWPRYAHPSVNDAPADRGHERIDTLQPRNLCSAVLFRRMWCRPVPVRCGSQQ